MKHWFDVEIMPKQLSNRSAGIIIVLLATLISISCALQLAD